jgi:hypothetical protein
MQYIALFIFVLIAIVMFWKFFLIALVGLAVIVGIYFLIVSTLTKQKEARGAKQRESDDAERLAAARDRIENFRRELSPYFERYDNLEVNSTRSREVLPWKKIETLQLDQKLHHEFVQYICSLAESAAALLRLLRLSGYATDEVLSFECDGLNIFYRHQPSEADGHDRCLTVNWKGERVVNCEQLDPEFENWTSEIEIIKLGGFSFNKTAFGYIVTKKYTVETFRLGSWLDVLISWEKDIQVIKLYQESLRIAKNTEDHKSRFGRID